MLILNDVPGGTLADRVRTISMLSSDTTGMPSTESMMPHGVVTYREAFLGATACCVVHRVGDLDRA